MSNTILDLLAGTILEQKYIVSINNLISYKFTCGVNVVNVESQFYSLLALLVNYVCIPYLVFW